jgi:ABC-type amino acid transport substrate-binding protein
MKSGGTLVISVILSAIIAFTISKYAVTPTALAPVQETAFDRIMRTNTLRCGYAIATPWMMADPNTKQLSGVDYDVTNAIAQKVGLKVEWVEETGWGVAEQGLTSNRYDMLCGSVCIDPRRARAATFSAPFLHIPLVAVVRAGDHRFDSGIQSINNKDVRIGVKNGHVFEFTANEKFPAAQKIYANDISDDTEFFEMLKTNKIDVAFSGQVTVDLYNEKNPGAIRALDEPARYCNGAFMVPLGDTKLKYMIDNAISELNSSGRIEEMLSHFTKLDPHYIRIPAMPFRENGK